jgi:RNA-directed DNA polymerase
LHISRGNQFIRLFSRKILPALEDKIAQRATASVLNQIYEEDFLGFSYGFRPKRSQHDALDALMTG